MKGFVLLDSSSISLQFIFYIHTFLFETGKFNVLQGQNSTLLAIMNNSETINFPRIQVPDTKKPTHRQVVAVVVICVYMCEYSRYV